MTYIGVDGYGTCINGTCNEMYRYLQLGEADFFMHEAQMTLITPFMEGDQFTYP